MGAGPQSVSCRGHLPRPDLKVPEPPRQRHGLVLSTRTAPGPRTPLDSPTTTVVGCNRSEGNIMRARVFVISAVLAAVSLAAAGHAVAGPPTGGVSNPVRVYPACVEEDGSGGPRPCVWDGLKRGNHLGSSYIVTATDRTAPLASRLCTASVTVNCRVVTDASVNYSEWVRADGSRAGVYNP